MHSIAPLLYSVASLRHLFAEQATPADVANFVLVCVAMLVFVSVGVYVGAMRILWARLRHGPHAFHEAFFDTSHFKDWAAEMLIAACTTLLLAYTFHLRHAVVEQIATAHSDRLVIEMAARGLVGSSDSTSLGASGAAAEAILKPLVTSGNAADAMALAGSLLKWPEPDGHETIRAKHILIAFAILMMVAYVGWELKQRYGALDAAFASGGKVSADYSRTIKGLAAIAVCIALLLVAAAPMDDEQHVVESALSAMKGRTLANPADTEAANRVANALVRADAGIRHSADSAIGRLAGENALLGDSLGKLAAHMLQSEADARRGDAKIAQQLAAQLGQVLPLAPRVERLEARADSGSIVVFADPKTSYAITRVGDNAMVAKGTGTAAYRVASGKYQIAPAGAKAFAAVAVDRGKLSIQCVVLNAPATQLAGAVKSVAASAAVGRGGSGKATAAPVASASYSNSCRASGG